MEMNEIVTVWNGEEEIHQGTDLKTLMSVLLDAYCGGCDNFKDLAYSLDEDSSIENFTRLMAESFTQVYVHCIELE